MSETGEIIERSHNVRLSVCLSRYGIAEANQTLQLQQIGVVHTEPGFDVRVRIQLTFAQAHAPRS